MEFLVIATCCISTSRWLEVIRASGRGHNFQLFSNSMNLRPIFFYSHLGLYIVEGNKLQLSRRSDDCHLYSDE